MPEISASPPPFTYCDMEDLDQYQHYFYDDLDLDEDFFKSTAPSEDIWKKFELVPTPPMSPVRRLDETAGSVGLSLGDKLEWVSHVLGQDDEDEAQCNLSSIIIQDCMWSGFSASQRFEKAVGEHISCQSQAKMPFVPQIGVITPGKNQCGHTELSSLSSSVSDCVDPAAVLTFPLSGCKKQVSSGSESHTDSSDDEEIDVVTVDHKRGKSRPVNSRKPVTITVRADPHDLGTKRFHISIHQQQHNYAAPSPDLDPPRKKIRQENSQPGPVSTSHTVDNKPQPPVPAVTIPAPSTTRSQSSASSHPASPQSSDSEDMDRRKNHNFLERKRRNDLRSRFLALRDEIPGLIECPKTPKVVILTKATEYLHALHLSEKQKTQEKKQLRIKQQQLLRKLAELKRS
ncbi:protein L-Myc-1b [Trichomycterus rosablanca]|uniref:protein L-Myc-1b n=1 Tax=Trichomycterus rosablanca TaxID=2290929 RepID=UPI002F359C62